MVFGPVAVYCSAKARRLMNENGYWGDWGFMHAASTGRYLGSFATVMWTPWIVLWLLNAHPRR